MSCTYKNYSAKIYDFGIFAIYGLASGVLFFFSGSCVLNSLHSPAYRALIGRLRAARIAAGITQAELAAKVGRPQPYISKIEHMERRLDVLEYLLLTQAIGADTCELLLSVTSLVQAADTEDQ